MSVERSNDEIFARLQASDHPRTPETPRKFDWTRERRSFDELARLLEQAFKCVAELDRNIQDASHHGTILIPADHTASPEFITITVSNFGKIAAVSLGNPGTFTKDEFASLYAADDRDRINACGVEAGYSVVPEHIFDVHYEGPVQLRTGGRVPTLWDRFFSYL